MASNYPPTKYDEFELHTYTTHLGQEKRVLQVEGMNFDVKFISSGFLPDVRENLKKIKAMACREDDVFMCAFMKAGTHWVWEVTTMLLKGKAEYEKVSKEKRMLEFHWPEEFETLPSPRTLNSHYPLRLLPEQLQNASKGKIIFIQRNPKDIAVSAFHHRKNLLITQFRYRFSDFLRIFLEHGMTCDWFTYTREWNQIIDNNKDLNIHVLYYEDLKSNPYEETRRLADFLEVEYDDQLIRDIADSCKFESLKQANKDIKAVSTGNPNPEMEDFQTMYRKGEVGDWKNWFTVKDNEMFDAAFAERTQKLTFKYTFDAGPLKQLNM